MNPNEFAYALGAGAFENENGLAVGEALVYEKKPCVYVPNHSFKNRLLKTPFMMGISRKPRDFLVFHEALSLSQFYEKILQNYSNGFALVGSINFSKLEVAYLKTPPIYHENINKYRDKYWVHETYDYFGIQMFGVVLHKLNPKAFYQNPNDSLQNVSYFSHSHALVNQNEARHLLTQSVMMSGRLWIEEIKL